MRLRAKYAQRRAISGVFYRQHVATRGRCVLVLSTFEYAAADLHTATQIYLEENMKLYIVELQRTSGDEPLRISA